jgi:thioesterase domain-containing protein
MKTAMKILKPIVSTIFTAYSFTAFAQMVVTNPSQDYILLESKIEAASNWLKQLNGLQQTIQLAREQAGKLDSAKRAVEKGYELQEKVRTDAENNYNAVKQMNEHNLAEIMQSYLGFSINPSDYLPEMTGMDGYTEFKNSVDYNPSKNVAPSTRKIDRFLSSVALTDSLLSIDNPVEEYFLQLDRINKLAGAYGTFYFYRRRSEAELLNSITLPRQQSLLEYLLTLQDSVQSIPDLIALRLAIEAAQEKQNQDKEKLAALEQELLDAAVRVANIRNIAIRKQNDLITMYAATSCHYNLNKNFSLRKLAENSSNKAKEKALKQKIKNRDLGINGRK